VNAKYIKSLGRKVEDKLARDNGTLITLIAGLQEPDTCEATKEYARNVVPPMGLIPVLLGAVALFGGIWFITRK
jgi:hypothetical protein